MNKRTNVIIFLCSIVISIVSGCGTSSPLQIDRKITLSTLPVSLIWQTKVEYPIVNKPIMTSEQVIIQTSYALYSLDVKTGEQQWAHDFDRRQPWPNPLQVSDNKIIYGEENGQVTALNLIDGELVWQHVGNNDTPKSNYGVESIIIDGDVVYVATHPTVIKAFDLHTGESLWSIDGSDSGIPSRGAEVNFDDDNLYVLTNMIHVLKKDTGEVKEAYDISLDTREPAQMINGKIYTTGYAWNPQMPLEENKLMLDTSSSTHCAFNTPYTITDSHYFAPGCQGMVYAVSIDTDEAVWVYETSSIGESPTAIYHGNLYVLLGDGTIHAMDIQTGDNQGILQMNRRLPGMIVNASSNARGLVSNESILVATFNDQDVWAFCEEPCILQDEK